MRVIGLLGFAIACVCAAIETGVGWRAAHDQVTVTLDPALTETLRFSVAR